MVTCACCSLISRSIISNVKAHDRGMQGINYIAAAAGDVWICKLPRCSWLHLHPVHRVDQMHCRDMSMPGMLG